METRFLLRAARLRPRPSLRSRTLTRHHSTSTPSREQAAPIGDYYASILESATPGKASRPPATASPSSAPATSATPAAADADTDAGPSILFSSRLSSPLERRSEIKRKSVLVAGVWVPPKPDEPDNCCMSGCVNCVWDRYGEELEEWAAARKQADGALRKERSLEKARKRRPGLSGQRRILGQDEEGAVPEAVSMDDDDGGGSDTNWGTGLEMDFTSEDLYKGVPVGIREFMKQEKRLKEKRAKEGTRSG